MRVPSIRLNGSGSFALDVSEPGSDTGQLAPSSSTPTGGGAAACAVRVRVRIAPLSTRAAIVRTAITDRRTWTIMDAWAMPHRPVRVEHRQSRSGSFQRTAGHLAWRDERT